MSSQYAQTRRAFLGTSVAVGAAAAIGGTLGYGSIASADEQVWDMAADFVVVGGGTGLGGAVAAAVNGMSVILLESRDAVGGAMALSGGCAWLPNTEYSQANGDTYELSLTYLTHMQQEYKNFEVMNAFLDNTQLTIDTLAEGGVLLSPLPYPVEYHSDWEGACNGGGRTTVVAGEDGTMTTVGGGMRMNDALVKACENLGRQRVHRDNRQEARHQPGNVRQHTAGPGNHRGDDRRNHLCHQGQSRCSAGHGRL